MGLLKNQTKKKKIIKTDKKHTLFATAPIFLAPKETVQAPCKFDENTEKMANHQNTKYNIETTEELKRANCIIRAEHEGRRNSTQITNLSNNPIEIEAGTIIGYHIPTVVLNNGHFETLCNVLLRTSKLSDKSRRQHMKEVDEWKRRRSQLIKNAPLTTEIEIVISKPPDNRNHIGQPAEALKWRKSWPKTIFTFFNLFNLKP